MSAPKEEMDAEDWKMLTSMDGIVNRMGVLSDNPRSSCQEKTWKSRLRATVGFYVLAQSIYHLLVTNFASIYVRITQTDEDVVLIFIDQASYILRHCFVITRILTFHLQPSEIYAMVDGLKDVHKSEQFNGEEVKSLLQNAQTEANWIHRVLKVVFVMIAIVIAATFCTQTTTSENMFLNGWFPLDVTSSHGFVVTFLFLGSFATLLPIIVGQTDVFIICFLHNLASQFEVLCCKFEHIRDQAVRNVAKRHKKIRIVKTRSALVSNLNEGSAENSDSVVHFQSFLGEGNVEDDFEDQQLKDEEDVASDSEDGRLKEKEDVDVEMCRLLGTLIDHHVTLVRLTREFEKIFNPLLRSQIGTNLFLTALCVFLITKEGIASHRLVLLSNTTLVLVSEMFTFCLLADRISTQTDRVRDCAFNCEWLRSSSRFNKSLRVVMSMANKELRVRVSGHVPLSMEIFVQITKFSWSMVTLARSLTDPAKRQV